MSIISIAYTQIIFNALILPADVQSKETGLGGKLRLNVETVSTVKNDVKNRGNFSWHDQCVLLKEESF